MFFVYRSDGIEETRSEEENLLVPGQSRICFSKQPNAEPNGIFRKAFAFGKNVRLEGLANLGNTCYLNAVVQVYDLVIRTCVSRIYDLIGSGVTSKLYETYKRGKMVDKHYR